MIDIVATQLADLVSRYPEASIVQSDGNRLLVVPNVPIGSGWSSVLTTVSILIPTNYPHVKPDCFYTESSLLLANGRDPVNSTIQSVFGRQFRWFSWHLQSWDASSGSLYQFVNFCRRRLQDAR